MLFLQSGMVVCGVADEEEAILEASPVGERKVLSVLRWGKRLNWEGDA